MKLIHGVKVMTVYTKLNYLCRRGKTTAHGGYIGVIYAARLDGGRKAVMSGKYTVFCRLLGEPQRGRFVIMYAKLFVRETGWLTKLGDIIYVWENRKMEGL